MESYYLIHSENIAWLALATIFGLIAGSFLNVVIVRLPIMMDHAWREACAELHAHAPPPQPRYNLAWPRSHCPACQHVLAWHELIPVLSWLRLRGRCAHCSATIPVHYPLVELVTAFLFAACVWQLGPGAPSLAAMALCAVLIALAMIDIRTMLLPDSLTQPLLWAGLMLAWSGHGFTGLHDAVSGAALGYGLLWLIATGFRLIARKEGMGQGDLKLLAALGAWFGWQALPAIILMASLGGVVVGLGLLALGKASRGQALPFGPYLAAAGLVWLLVPAVPALASIATLPH